jgi:hypothetical protein
VRSPLQLLITPPTNSWGRTKFLDFEQAIAA